MNWPMNEISQHMWEAISVCDVSSSLFVKNLGRKTKNQVKVTNKSISLSITAPKQEHKFLLDSVMLKSNSQ